MNLTRRDFARLGALAAASRFVPKLYAADSGPRKTGYAVIGLGRIAGHFMPAVRNTTTSQITGLVSGHRDKADRIPLIVHHAAGGDFAPFLQQAIAPSIPDFIADGMYLSVTCAEDVPFINPEEAAKLTAGNPFGSYRVFQQTRACGMWPRGEIPTDFLQPVHSNAPVLIFSGNMDPVTPPKYGEEVARHLPNSRHVIIPEAGHGVDGLTDPDCIERIAIEFLDKGDAKNLDVGCVERMARPPFVTK